jgi:hypothetical protein
MARRKPVSTGLSKSPLPSRFAAWRCVCEWFGVEMPELEEMLQLVRAREERADDYLPKHLDRVMLGEAEDGKGPWCEGLISIASRALHARINFRNERVLSGFAGDVAGHLAFTMLRLYEDILPGIKAEGLSQAQVLWVLFEEVFMPTAYIELALNRRRGIGNEFEGDTWYLPVVNKGTLVKPVQRVVEYWLRAAGFRNGYDVGKALNSSDSEAVEKKVNRWSQGKHVPEIVELHELVERFASNVPWSGTVEEWMSRFTLACAVQKLCDVMDAYFQSAAPNASLQLAGMLQQTHAAGPAIDDDLVLADRQIFFAAWLLQRRLVAEGIWETEVAARVRETLEKKCPENPTDDELEELRAGRRTRPGNWFLGFTESELAAGRLVACARGKDMSFHECMVAVGIRELNRIFDSKRAGGLEARQP